MKERIFSQKRCRKEGQLLTLIFMIGKMLGEINWEPETPLGQSCNPLVLVSTNDLDDEDIKKATAHLLSSTGMQFTVRITAKSVFSLWRRHFTQL